MAHARCMHVCTVTHLTLCTASLAFACIEQLLWALTAGTFRPMLAHAAVMPIQPHLSCKAYSCAVQVLQATSVAAQPLSSPSPIPKSQGVPNTKMDLALHRFQPPPEAVLSLTTASASAADETAAASVLAVRPREASVKGKAVPQVCLTVCKLAVVAVAAVMWHTYCLRLCTQLGFDPS